MLATPLAAILRYAFFFFRYDMPRLPYAKSRERVAAIYAAACQRAPYYAAASLRHIFRYCLFVIIYSLRA